MASNNSGGGHFPKLPVILFLIFMTLKLCGAIDWSWWWVTAPLWIPGALALVFVAFCLMMAGVTIWLKWRRHHK